MSATVNNGIRVGSVSVLVTETPRKGPFHVVRDLAVSLLLGGDATTADRLVTVHAESGEVIASRQFDSAHRAERARTDLVTAAKACDDLDTFDWPSNLARI